MVDRSTSSATRQVQDSHDPVSAGDDPDEDLKSSVFSSVTECFKAPRQATPKGTQLDQEMAVSKKK